MRELLFSLYTLGLRTVAAYAVGNEEENCGCLIAFDIASNCSWANDQKCGSGI